MRIGPVGLVVVVGAGPACNYNASGVGSGGGMTEESSSGDVSSSSGNSESGLGSVDSSSSGSGESSSGLPPSCAMPSTWYPDVDGDGYGDPRGAVSACEAPEGHVEQAGDCNDRAVEANPDQLELCDELDNDCDGKTDEWSRANADVCFGCEPVEIGGSIYYACAGSMSWTDGETLCQDRGAELVSIHNDAQNDLLRLFLDMDGAFDYAFIGFNDREREGEFVWSDGSVVDFENWADGNPNDTLGTQDCAVIQPSTGVWFDRPCSNAGPDNQQSDAVVCLDPDP